MPVETRAMEQSTFEELVAPYRERMGAAAYHLCGDPETAQDIVQETMLDAWRGLARLRDRSRAGPWLFAILRRKALAHRKTRRHEPLTHDIPADGPDGSAALVMSIVMEQMDRLSPEDRDVLAGKYLLGLSYAEIAEALGVKEGTVAVRCFRAKERLREALQRDLPDVPLKMNLWSTELLYLDPSRRHHLLLAWSAIQNEPPVLGRRAPGASILMGVVRSNVAWTRPQLPPGTYLLWWVWPAGASSARWEVSLPDGSQRRVLDAEPAEPSAASQANRSGRPFPQDMNATLYRYLFPEQDGAFPVCVQVKTMREGKPQGTGWFRLSAP